MGTVRAGARPISGDSGLDQIAALERGEIDFTLAQKPYEIGQLAVEWGYKYLTEGEVERVSREIAQLDGGARFDQAPGCAAVVGMRLVQVHRGPAVRAARRVLDEAAPADSAITGTAGAPASNRMAATAGSSVAAITSPRHQSTGRMIPSQDRPAAT